MTKESLAGMLNGNAIGHELPEHIERLAKQSGLVVIFGASDDLCELRGAIDDELNSYGGYTFSIGKDGVLLAGIEDDDFAVLERYGVLDIVEDMRRGAPQVEACWCKTDEYSWTYETKVPHCTFDIQEGGEKYCRGIVIDLKELSSPA